MTWAPRFRDQGDLERLCAPREVYPVEYHVQNHLFGFDRLIKEYAGLPPEDPLPWAMEHAIHFDAPEPYFAELESPLPVFLAVTEGQAAALRSRLDRPVHAIGSAFHYMLRVGEARWGSGEGTLERKGTIVFPDKSTTHQDTDYDRERFAAELASLPAEYQPVAVSVFWKDWQRGTHEPFRRAGLELVTSGHPYDPDFLFRQYDLCRRFRWSAANDLSTSFCLSILAGCRFFHWPTGPLRVTRGGRATEYAAEPTLHLPGKRECVRASPWPPVPDDGGLQRGLAELWSGAGCVRPPGFFRSLAEEARSELRSRTPAPVDFDRVRLLAEVAGWLPQGLDADGWACRRFSVEAPEGSRGAALVLTLLHPMGERPGRVRWTVTAGSSSPRTFEVEPGWWRLAVPIDRIGPARRVVLEADREEPLPGQARRRALRVVRLELGPGGRRPRLERLPK